MADLAVTAAEVGLVDPLKAEVHSGLAAEAITKGQAVYQTSTGTFGVADANVAGKQQVRGVALEDAAAGQAVDLVKRGLVYGFTLTSQNHDTPVYLSDTAGALADAAGTLAVPCGLVVALADKAKTKVLWLECRWAADFV